MSSNGIGLQTARGSGTTGHVQRNIASVKDHKNEDSNSGYFKRRQISKQRKIKYDKRSKRSNNDEAESEIKEHYLKRDIEVKCMELRDTLEDESEDELVILTKVNNLRAKLLNDSELVEGRTCTKSLDVSSTDNKSNVESEGTGDAYNYKRRYTDSNELDRTVRARIRR